MVHTPGSYSRVQFTVRRLVIIANAFHAFDQRFRAKTEIKGKGKPVPVQTSYRLRGFHESEAPRLQDSQHMVVRL